MAKIDNAAAIRDRAYAIWEREGCPSGREHEHWAEAAREIERLCLEAGDKRTVESAQDHRVSDDANQGPTNDREIERLRRALYEPAEFSRELFGEESEIVISAGNDDRDGKKKLRRAFG